MHSFHELKLLIAATGSYLAYVSERWRRMAPNHLVLSLKYLVFQIPFLPG